MTGESQPDTISVVLPTYNRLPALQRNFGSLLALEGVAEIVVIVDGSTDGSAEWLASLEDPRLRVTVQSQSGSPAARNRGVDLAAGTWVLMTEDDCYLPPDFATTLLDVANRMGADIVSAPWLAAAGAEEGEDAIARGRRAAQEHIGLSTHPSVFPTADLETPFLSGIILARREVLRRFPYDPRLRGNAWREETSLFLSAVAAGYRCVLTPRTASLQLGQWEGGQRLGRLSYEYWAIRNNWRFLRRHRVVLAQIGAIRGPLSAQSTFVLARLRSVLVGTVRARWSRVRARRS
jgi:GT2 family glycosyltransferase